MEVNLWNFSIKSFVQVREPQITWLEFNKKDVLGNYFSLDKLMDFANI